MLVNLSFTVRRTQNEAMHERRETVTKKCLRCHLCSVCFHSISVLFCSASARWNHEESNVFVSRLPSSPLSHACMKYLSKRYRQPMLVGYMQKRCLLLLFTNAKKMKREYAPIFSRFFRLLAASPENQLNARKMVSKISARAFSQK